MRSKEENIEVIGARAHNLKNIDISIPKNKLVVITGISGSGKSSLAFDTIYAEGHRRYMETFGTYARQFMGEMERPDVDKISGLSPVISIEQKTTNKNPRSTVGTVTEVYDFLRLFFARVGEAYSLNTGKKMVKFSDEEIVADLFKKLPGKKITVLAPLVRGRKGHYRELFEETRKKGFVRVRVDGELKELVPKMQVDRYKMHDIEVVVDRLVVEADMKVRIAQSIQQSMQIGKGLIFILDHDNDKLIQYSKKLMCADSGISYEEPSPNTFSFNSPYGACSTCKGIGQQYTIDLQAVIPDRSLSIADGAVLPLGEARDSFYFKMVEQLAKKKKFSLKTPIDQLSESALNLVLFGDEEGLDAEEVELEKGDYPGVVNMVVKWFTDSSSDMVREWAEKYMMLKPCTSCNGARLKQESLWFKIDETNIAELSDMDLNQLHDWFNDLEKRIDKKQNAIAKDILKEIRSRLLFLLDVGLGYLSLSRPSRSLSGGESQRIRLATQIGSQLQGITYILDEPSIGLHQRDNQRLIKALQNLRDIGNSVLVVEHDKDIMMASDHLIDVGPRAGIHGGTIVAQGTPQEVCNSNSETALYLNNRKKIELPKERRQGNGNKIQLMGAKGNNLKAVNADFPLGTFIVVSGVSGSGKSTLINETLYPLLSKHCYDSKADPMPYKRIVGLEHVDKVIEIDQSPIGRTPRSNPATYCNFFTDIRQLFAAVPEAKIRGYNAGRFSFNVKAGRCDVCEGGGLRVIEMNFLPDVYVHCEKCNGRRYNRETLEIRYKGKSISDVLDMTVEEAVGFFQHVPYLFRKIKILQEVGLGYITLGQSAVTLSGGEAQRVKLGTELSKKDTGKTFYILDEPTTGLHFQDINLLLTVLNKLVNRGNTVLVIEHNMDVIKMADYIIDIGVEGGNGGGDILYQGDVYGLLKVKESHTGKYLKQELQ
jgi:excinuclease ABC subunit A